MRLKHILRNFSILMAMPLVVACSSNDEPEPVPSRPMAPEDAQRTVLVYMAADNSLGSASCDTADLAEMRVAVDRGDLGAKGRLLIYHNEPGTARGKVPVLYEMLPGGYNDTLKVYPDNPKIYSVDVARMREVLDDVDRFAPAPSKGIVLWSHGSGWQETSDSRSVMAYSFGEDRGQTMKVSSLAQALQGRNLDFIYFDCCFMGSVEVAYELRYCAKVMAASATELPIPGTCYDLNLTEFFRLPEADMIGAARNTFNHYNQLEGMQRTCTMSVIDLTKMEALAAITRKVMEQKFQDFSVTDSGMQKYMRNDRVCTLFDMEQYIEALCKDDPELLAQWRKVLHETVLYTEATPWIFSQLPINRHCGLGTFIISRPSQSTYRGYDKQQWWKDVVSHAPALSN